MILRLKYFEEMTPFRSLEHGGRFTEMVESGIRITLSSCCDLKSCALKGIEALSREKPIMKILPYNKLHGLNCRNIMLF